MKLLTSLMSAVSTAAVLTVGALAFASVTASPVAASETVVLKAGTILTVDGTGVISNGSILVVDGRIQAVGMGLDVPLGAKLVDYGPDAVIAPGFVSAYSHDQGARANRRAANPGMGALETFDFYDQNFGYLRAGVTTTYVVPATGRLISGHGAVIKTFGDDREQRTLKDWAALHGAIDSSARNTPGYWDPPIPATVDVGIGYAMSQLPKTTMGAILGLEELVALGKSGAESEAWGPGIAAAMKHVLDSKMPWRIGAVEEHEVRALIGFAKSSGLPIIIDKAHGAKGAAALIAEAGLPVIYQVPTWGRDYGKDEDARWPDFSVPAALVKAGVRVAISSTIPSRLLFDAQVASRGGLSKEAALRAITLTPAELLGVADRVGSIKVGKDADFAILSGHPLTGGTVVATWMDGELALDPEERAKVRREVSEKENEHVLTVPVKTYVIAADEVHVGDGTVHAPGEILMRGGKIVSVGRRVPRPAGATVVKAGAVMPGIIDARSYLGLEGSSTVPGLDFDLSQIISPGDAVDRRVALGGVTTVVMTPRGSSSRGVPSIAYKPAATERQVVATPTSIQMGWASSNILASGKSVEKALKKAQGYKAKWDEYNAKMATWTPPAEEADAVDESDEDEDEADKDSDKDDKKDGDADKKKKKKKKKKKGKKKEKEELEPDPVTGRWVADDENGDVKFRFRLVPGLGSGDIEGNLRSDKLSSSLVELTGSWNRDERTLMASGLGSNGWVQIEAKLEEGKFVGTAKVGADTVEFTAERKSKDYPVAKRSQKRVEKPEPKKAPKGQPKRPKFDPNVEPFRAILEGRSTLIISVSSWQDILAAVDMCESYGVKPVLYRANSIHSVASRIAGRIGGVLMSSGSSSTEDLQALGIKVAFYTNREEGAIDLPLMAAYAIQRGMSPDGALRALTSDTAAMFHLDGRVGLLAQGMDADVLALDGPPLAPGTSVTRAWVNGREIVTP